MANVRSIRLVTAAVVTSLTIGGASALEAQTIARIQGLSLPSLGPLAESSVSCRNEGVVRETLLGGSLPLCELADGSDTRFISGRRVPQSGGSVLGIGDVRTTSDGLLRAYSELRVDDIGYAGEPSVFPAGPRGPQFLNIVRTGFREELSFTGVVPSEVRLRFRIDGRLTSSSRGLLDEGSYAIFTASAADDRATSRVREREGWGACMGSRVGCSLDGTGVGFQTISFSLLSGFSSFTFDYFASIVAGLYQPLSLAPGETWSGFATADFLGTIGVEGASFFDVDGREITDRVSASWSSGRVIPPIRTVPEPATFVLLGLGLVGLATTARRRRA